MSRKTIPKKTRLELYEKYNHRCGYCGCEIVYKDMQVDHLKPVYVHGEYLGDMDSEQLNDISNFIPACRQCNLYKSTFELEEFREQLKTKEIMFFDTNYYIETRNFDGFIVKMESLVK